MSDRPMGRADLKAEVERLKKRLNISLKSFLMPIFEAIDNALHASKAANSKDILITITRDKESSIRTIEVSDSGIGLDKNNFEAFETPYTGHRMKYRGKGIGRFIGHVVFRSIKYKSYYKDSDKYKVRSFDFTLEKEKEFSNYLEESCEEEKTGTYVTYSSIFPEYTDFLNTKPQNIKEELCLHFLLQLTSDECNITIKDGEHDSVLLNKSFRDLHGDEFSLPNGLHGKLNKYYTTEYILKKNAVFWIAHNRAVGGYEDLSTILGVKSFSDESGFKYVYGVFVYGEFLDDKVNQIRTGFDGLSKKERDTINREIANKIMEVEKKTYAAVKEKQQKSLEYLLDLDPSLAGLKASNIDGLPPSYTKPEDIMGQISKKVFREKRDIVKRYEEVLKEKNIKNDDYIETVNEISRHTQFELAAYITYRDKITL